MICSIALLIHFLALLLFQQMVFNILSIVVCYFSNIMYNLSSSNLQCASTWFNTNPCFANKHAKEIRYQNYCLYFIQHTNNLSTLLMNLYSNKNWNFYLMLSNVQKNSYLILNLTIDPINFIFVPDSRNIFNVVRWNEFLPNVPLSFFGTIQELFHFIFHEDLHVYRWDSLIKELSPFLIYDIFSFLILSSIHNT